MSDILFIGSRRYSSWSLRGWLAVRLAGLAVEEIVLPLDGSGASPAVRAQSPSLKVPYLRHGGNEVWESLAIGEYCAEITPRLWPAATGARAWARSIAHEMHAGFRDLRIAWPMNLGRVFPPAPPGDAVQADLARIEAVWAETRLRFAGDGPFLFGADFTLADVMFAPVVARLITYQPDLTPHGEAYCVAVREHPLVEAWYAEAAGEPAAWQVAKWERPPG